MNQHDTPAKVASTDGLGPLVADALTAADEYAEAVGHASSVEARAAELHEGCRMPMEQARELAESEAKPTPNLELFAAFGAADAAKEQDLRGYYPMAARVLAEEVRSLKAQLAKFTPLRAKGVVDADDNLDCWDTNPYEICTRHVAALNEKDPAAMWRVVDLFARDEG